MNISDHGTTITADLELADSEVSNRHLRAVMERVGTQLAPVDFLRAVMEAYRHTQRRLEPSTVEPQFQAEASHHAFREGLQQACSRLEGPARILALGCSDEYAGCGSAYAEQVVREVIPPAKIRSLGSRHLTRAEWNGVNGRFDVIVSHSVLHFIPELGAAVRRIVSMLVEGGLYLMAHEPNARFWRNSELLEERGRMTAERMARVRRARLLSMSSYVTKLRALVATAPTTGMDKLVNHYLQDCYSMRADLSAHEIVRMVDAHKPSEGADEFRIGLPGLEAESLRGLGLDASRLIWKRTYDHLGYAEYRALSAGWRERNRQLGELHPNDGVAWSALWLKP